MPAKKSSKKARKTSGKKDAERGDRNRARADAKKGAGSKRVAKKASTKKAGTKKAGTKKRAASTKTAAKGAAGRAVSHKAAGRGAKKAATTRGATRKGRASGGFREATATAALIGNCLGLTEAGAIVENAIVLTGGISPSSFDIDKKLEQMGVISTNQCSVVTSRILQDVRAFPCTINDGAAACTPDMKARALIDSVQANAGRP